MLPAKKQKKKNHFKLSINQLIKELTKLKDNGTCNDKGDTILIFNLIRFLLDGIQRQMRHHLIFNFVQFFVGLLLQLNHLMLI